MIVVPVVNKPKIPRKYIKEKCIHSKLISVEYKVNTYIKFEKFIERYYENKMFNNKPCIVEKEKLHPEVKYGFQITIELDAKEHEEKSVLGKNILDSYILEKAKNTKEYRNCIYSCLQKEKSERKYHIETFIADYKFNRRTSETEEYLPIY